VDDSSCRRKNAHPDFALMRGLRPLASARHRRRHTVLAVACQVVVHPVRRRAQPAVGWVTVMPR
jgi:hypothetical protein